MISALQLFWADAEPDTIEILKPYVAPEIYKWQYPARSLLDNGAIISGASDWPVSTASVFRAIYQAETRKGPEGVLDASQDMPRLAMFYAYTRNSAIAMNMPDVDRDDCGRESAPIWFCSIATCSPSRQKRCATPRSCGPWWVARRYIGHRIRKPWHSARLDSWDSANFLAMKRPSGNCG